MTAMQSTEISAISPTSFEAAIENGIKRANLSLDKIEGAWIKNLKVIVNDEGVHEYHVDLRITYLDAH